MNLNEQFQNLLHNSLDARSLFINTNCWHQDFAMERRFSPLCLSSLSPLRFHFPLSVTVFLSLIRLGSLCSPAGQGGAQPPSAFWCTLCQTPLHGERHRLLYAIRICCATPPTDELTTILQLVVQQIHHQRQRAKICHILS